MEQVFLKEVEIRLLCINCGIWCSVMMTLRFGIITCPTVQSIQMTTLLFLVQIDASGMFLNWRKRHLAIKSVFFFKQHDSDLLGCFTLLKCCTYNTYSSYYLFFLWGSTWNDLRWRSVYRNPPRSLSPPLIPSSLLQEACPELSQNEASPLQRSLWDQREDGWVSTSLSFFVFSTMHRLEPSLEI